MTPVHHGTQPAPTPRTPAPQAAAPTPAPGAGPAALSYVLITPAHNEEACIDRTLRSVTSQRVPPIRWIIVSDGSTDRTEQLVDAYARDHDWIQLVRLPEHRDRTFAAKVGAFNAGYAEVKHLAYDAIGSVDADISFEADYVAFLLEKLASDPTLGLVGTPFTEGGSTYDYRFTSIEHVSGAFQLFRRECFEQIGGYTPIRGGGIDLAAVISARMHGWKTRTFTEKTCVHHRAMHGASHGVVMAKFRDGQKDYALGGHPLWELFRCAYQSTKPPYLFGAVMLAAGYFSAVCARRKRPVSTAFVAFRRKEQMARLRTFCRRPMERTS